MLQKLDTQAYLERLLAAPRPGTEKVLAFYDHNVGAVGTDPRLMVIPLDDHLVHRGDGVFETMKWIGRKVYQLDAHLARMDRSSKSIFLAPPCPWEQVRELCLDVCRAVDTDSGYLRVLVGRGPGGFGIDPTECPTPSLHIVAYRFKPKPEEAFEKGLRSFRTSIPAKQSWMATIKSTDYLPNVLMRRETLEKGYDQPICFDRDGFLSEGATENICLVDDRGRLVVPEFSNCLAGTTMVRAMELVREKNLGIEVQFHKVTEAEVYAARELMVVGTTADAIAIVRYNDKPIGDGKPGPVVKQLRALLQADLQQTGVAF